MTYSLSSCLVFLFLGQVTDRTCSDIELPVAASDPTADTASIPAAPTASADFIDDEAVESDKSDGDSESPGLSSDEDMDKYDSADSFMSVHRLFDLLRADSQYFPQRRLRIALRLQASQGIEDQKRSQVCP